MNNLLLPICLFALAAPALAQSQPDALAPMQAYVRAHETGDPAHLRQAFSADAKALLPPSVPSRVIVAVESCQ